MNQEIADIIQKKYDLSREFLGGKKGLQMEAQIGVLKTLLNINKYGIGRKLTSGEIDEMTLRIENLEVVSKGVLPPDNPRLN